MKNTPKVYTITGCPYCIRVKSHLRRLGVGYEEIKVPRLRSLRREVKRISGQNKVPVLVDGDTVIADSSAICEYLTEHYGSGPGSETAPARG